VNALAPVEPGAARRTLFRVAILQGVGLAGALDEILFHQLLQWHNLYVHTDQHGRIVSDGLLHLLSTAILLAGVLLLWRHARLVALAGWRVLAAGLLVGLGGFNLYDGTVQHKLLRLHPVREGVANQLPYDLAWNAVSLALLVVGWLIWRAAHGDGRVSR
jgi:uncharacterized membrane protein